MMADIQQMRPFLVRNFHADKAIVKVSENLVIAWDWCLAFGVAHVFFAQSREAILEAQASRSVRCMCNVGLNGLLIDYRQPWRTTRDLPQEERQAGLLANLYIIERLHGKLFSFYDQIDFDAIRSRAEAATGPELDDDELAVCCQDLATAEQEELSPPTESLAAKPTASIRPLRLQRLIRVLRDKCRCEIERGKGSEYTVYRSGGKKFVLAAHKADYSVALVIVKQLLKRVGISAVEWVAACK
jgi:hypothetical protein